VAEARGAFQRASRRTACAGRRENALTIPLEGHKYSRRRLLPRGVDNCMGMVNWSERQTLCRNHPWSAVKYLVTSRPAAQGASEVLRSVDFAVASHIDITSAGRPWPVQSYVRQIVLIVYV
jgi:hypothetical protein